MYCGHIWTGSILTFLPRPSWKAFGLPWGWWIFSYPTNHFPQWNVASHLLLRRYFHGRCSRELHNFVLPLQTFSIRIHHAAHTESIHTHFFHISLVRWKLHSDSFAPRTVSFWKGLPTGSLLDHYNLGFYKSNVNGYISYIA